MTRMANEHERADHDRDLRKHAILTIPDINTRFTRPIVCPKTGERVSAETLYNRCCADLGYVVRDHIGDLVFDNLDYSADETVCATDASNEALHDAVYAWDKGVREQIACTPQQAAGARSPVVILREALQHALDELHRVNASHACVRPDVTYAAMDALRKTFLAPIENASEVEQRIVGKLVQDILNADYSITIYNGGDDAELSRSTIAADIYKALAASDQDELVISKGGKRIGWIRLVWGNDVDVISDYNTRLETVMAAANALAEELDR